MNGCCRGTKFYELIFYGWEEGLNSPSTTPDDFWISSLAVYCKSCWLVLQHHCGISHHHLLHLSCHRWSSNSLSLAPLPIFSASFGSLLRVAFCLYSILLWFQQACFECQTQRLLLPVVAIAQGVEAYNNAFHWVDTPCTKCEKMGIVMYRHSSTGSIEVTNPAVAFRDSH